MKSGGEFEDDPDAEDVPRVPSSRRIRPRDAATLILMRGSGPDARILMGRRHGAHLFMPNKFVFPGGRVDRGDYRVPSASELRPEVAARAAHGLAPASARRRKARALALAAIRETFEETGLVVGRTCARPPRSRAQGWRDFLARGAWPHLHPLELVARAVTPPSRVRRFDARFFLANADNILGGTQPDDFRGRGSGELLELHWLTLAEAQGLDVPIITRFVLGELERRAKDGPGRPVPFVSTRHGRTVIDRL